MSQDIEKIRCNAYEDLKSCWKYALAYQGSDHIRHGAPCQDYCGFKTFNNGITVLAISDGHGSASLSEHGSKFAVETIISLVDKCISMGFSEMDIIRYFREKAGRVAIIDNWVERIAKDWKNRCTAESPVCDDKVVDMYGATLIFCIIFSNFILTGFVGDGALLLVDKLCENVEVVLSAADDVGESTCSLSHQRPDFFDIRLFNRSDFCFAFLSTDGLAKPYGENIYDISKNCAKEFLRQKDELKQSIDAFMENSHPSIGDDISLVFAGFGN